MNSEYAQYIHEDPGRGYVVARWDEEQAMYLLPMSAELRRETGGSAWFSRTLSGLPAYPTWAEALRQARRVFGEPTVYTVSCSPDAWGPDCQPEWAEELAEALAKALRRYADARGWVVEVMVVPDTTAAQNQPEGNTGIIDALDAERDRLLNGAWEWARGTAAYGEWQ